MPHRICARDARRLPASTIQRDPDLLRGFLTDAAHVPGGWASGIAFPGDEAEVATLVAAADHVLPIGAQSSLTGGATPRGDLLISTRAMTTVGEPAAGRVRVQAGVPLAMLQRVLASHGLYYPPAPTYEGASIGGTIATNAAGAATFKYGTTRRWIEELTVVLDDGSVLDVTRGAVAASAEGGFEIVDHSGSVRLVPVPRYTMPRVAKLSAGYYAAPQMDLVDLFIGAEGTLGVVTAATLRVIPRPRLAVALVTCATDAQALAVTALIRARAADAWAGADALDTVAVEYIDADCLSLLDDTQFGRAGVERPPPRAALLLVQFDVTRNPESAFDALIDVLEQSRVAGDPIVALPDDERGAARLFELREAVPARVNGLIGDAKHQIDDAIQKTAGDMIVPFERIAESLELYRTAFARRGLPCAIWGHVSDGNLHPNVIPRSAADVQAGREALLEIAQGVMALGGAPLAEHGVGRNPLKQALLRAMYGDAGIDEMRAVKRALDPKGKLAAGVLFR